MNNNTVYEWLLQSTFTVSAREKSLQSSKPLLSASIHPGDQVLDLCCGSGFASFWLEQQGAIVTGIDFASYMISLARQEAIQRNSSVEFVEGDIFKQGFGEERFNLVTCFDSISDFPVTDFAKLCVKIASALKPGGRFFVKYMDGIYHKFIGKNFYPAGKYQETPELITFHVKDYLPDEGAFINTIRNETRQEEYDRKGYVYTPPMVGLAMGNSLELEQHIALDEYQFLDIFLKKI